MQINPCIRWGVADCDIASIRTYHGNVKCGAGILRNRFANSNSWVTAIKRYNGNGPRAELYLQQALAFIGRLTLEEMKAND